MYYFGKMFSCDLHYLYLYTLFVCERADIVPVNIFGTFDDKMYDYNQLL